MTKKKSKDKSGSTTIALNKRARHDYFIEKEFEAGLELQGWEVKSLRQGKANIAESFITVKNNETVMFGSSILPLTAASTHIICDPTRTRKLLLNRKEIISTFEAGPFDHEAGLAYLLSVLPRVGEGVPPEEIVLVGLEGECPAKTIERAARLSVLIAAQGLKDKDIG